MNELAHPLLEQQHFLVPDVRCAGCCLKIERALALLPGVEDVNVNYADRRLSFRAGADANAKVMARLNELGYPLTRDTAAEGINLYREQRRGMLARLGVAGIGMMQVMMFALASYLAGPGGIETAYEALMRWASLVITVPVVCYAALPFHRGALRDLRNLSPGMDVPVSLAICSAFVLSTLNTLSASGEVYFDSACMFTFFLLLGRYLELTARHSFQLEQSLGDHLLPAFARDAGGADVPVDEITAGQELLVQPGEVMPADGVVLEGSSSLDESAFTGENSPAFKNPGSKVLAGTTNLDGCLRIRSEAGRQDWVITHLGELYKQSSAYRPKFAVMADVIARYFVAAVLLLALGAGMFWWSAGSDNYFAIALAVLVVSCPCALSLATPVAYSIASGAVRNSGVLVKSGEFLEKLGRVTAVVFDKTGTLTEGRLQLERIVPIRQGLAVEEAVAIAAALEQDSLHPIAATLRDAADSLRTATAVCVEPGQGVSGVIEGATWRFGRPDYAIGQSANPPDDQLNWVLLASSGQPVCWFAFADRWRSGVAETVRELESLQIEVHAFSGDSSAEGYDGLRRVGIADPVMSMSPDRKIDELGKLQRAGAKVLMVGDGLNDAGAMALADMSLAVNPVDTLVQSASDATLTNSRISTIPGLVRYARKVKAIIRQNLTWALIYNFTVIPLAIAGLVAPWMAALGMSLSSLLVTLNACRLGRVA